jgi:hypothetical protein
MLPGRANKGSKIEEVRAAAISQRRRACRRDAAGVPLTQAVRVGG